VHDDGAIALLHKPSGRRVSSLVRFEDDADVGDLYTPAPRERACDVRFGTVRRVHRGPLRGELSIAARVTEPDAPRSQGGVDLVIGLMLDAGSSLLATALKGNNQRDDPRLRMIPATDVAGAAVWADAAFGPVRREPITPSADETQSERVPPTAPLHRYVSLFHD